MPADSNRIRGYGLKASFTGFFAAVIAQICLLLLLLISRSSNTTAGTVSKYVKKILRDREESLKRVVLAKPRDYPCSTTQFVTLEFPYGRSGNHFIQFANMLWVAHVSRRTLLVPSNMIIDVPNYAFRPSLQPFNLSVAHQQFCFIIDSDPHPTHDIISGLGDKSFNLQDIVYEQKNIAKSLHLPGLSRETVLEVSNFFVKVYAALWSNPGRKLRKQMISFLSNKLNRNFDYVSVHKRAMEGVCEKVINVLNVSVYNPTELPMDHPMWANVNSYHPLCQTPASFLQEVMKLNKREDRSLFVAYDGQGDCDDLEAMGAVFTKPMKGHARNHGSAIFGHLEENKWLDMGIAIHADLFIQNPASTFSWMVYVVRSALGLETIPTIAEPYDIYLRFPYDPYKHVHWVGWGSVHEVAQVHVDRNKSHSAKKSKTNVFGVSEVDL